MTRLLHRWPGLVAALLLVVISLSGTVLSVFPAVESLGAPAGATGLSVAELAARVQAAKPAVEQIRRAPSGVITAFWFDGNAPQAVVIDPATGQGVRGSDRSPFLGWLTELHRSLFLGNSGRITVALGAAAMVVLSVSGLLLVRRRTGGWRRFFAPLKGPLSGRVHVEIARVAVIGFSLSSLTALWMTAGIFGLLPQGPDTPPFPTAVSGSIGVAPESIGALQITPVERLRDLTFPVAGDATDVFTLQTDTGTGYIDQGTGDLLAWQGMDAWSRASETIYMLHTGKGAPLLGLVLGLIALTIPLMGVTGALVWARGRRLRPRIRGNVAARQAETVLLVGSEGGSTWGAAATLHKALTAQGQMVHTAPMSGFAPARYVNADRIIVLAATYGDGDAPASARGFMQKLAALDEAPRAPLAVLGFGDRSFPDYCAFARRVEALAREKGWAELLPFDAVDRQSPQDIARWGRALGGALGIALELNHQPAPPRSAMLTLVARRDYGAEVQSPSAILRFALPKTSLWHRLLGRGFGGFKAGDLLGVLPKGSELPRFYSLASSRRDGFVEICVRQHPGGLCSSQLVALEPGDTAQAFRRENPGFRPNRGRAPVILVGAGTGIGPLVGFVRANRRHRPMHLYFGARHPKSDVFYDREFHGWHDEGRLTSLATAYSRTARKSYVQDVLREDASLITRDIAAGGQVLVCGGRDMARGVAETLAEILAPMGLSPDLLKAEGRYAEDIY